MDWECIYCGRMNPSSLYECDGCTAGKYAKSIRRPKYKSVLFDPDATIGLRKSVEAGMSSPEFQDSIIMKTKIRFINSLGGT